MGFLCHRSHLGSLRCQSPHESSQHHRSQVGRGTFLPGRIRCGCTGLGISLLSCTSSMPWRSQLWPRQKWESSSLHRCTRVGKSSGHTCRCRVACSQSGMAWAWSNRGHRDRGCSSISRRRGTGLVGCSYSGIELSFWCHNLLHPTLGRKSICPTRTIRGQSIHWDTTQRFQSLGCSLCYRNLRHTNTFLSCKCHVRCTHSDMHRWNCSQTHEKGDGSSTCRSCKCRCRCNPSGISKFDYSRHR